MWAGQELHWALWCSAQIPLQDGHNDPYPSCQEYCRPKVCPQNISEALQIFPWIFNWSLCCNCINSSSVQLLLLPHLCCPRRALSNKLQNPQPQSLLTNALRSAPQSSQHCPKAEPHQPPRMPSGLPLQFKCPGHHRPDLLHHATYYVDYLRPITKSKVDKTCTPMENCIVYSMLLCLIRFWFWGSYFITW